MCVTAVFPFSQPPYAFVWWGDDRWAHQRYAAVITPCVMASYSVLHHGVVKHQPERFVQNCFRNNHESGRVLIETMYNTGEEFQVEGDDATMRLTIP